GDGMVLARHLDNRQVNVRVLLFGRPEDLTSDAAVNFQVLTRSGMNVEVYPGESPDLDRVRDELASAEWIVDALLGTGLRGPLRAPFDAVVGLINEFTARVLAVDIPSGPRGGTRRPLGSPGPAQPTA